MSAVSEFAIFTGMMRGGDESAPNGFLAREPRSTLVEAFSAAAMAPSSHNSQPWAVAHLESPSARSDFSGWIGTDICNSNEQCLLLALDEGRTLRALPAHAVEMQFSCGMFLELALAGLAQRGLSARVSAIDAMKGGPPIAGWPAAWLPIAAVAVGPGDTRAPEWSLDLLPTRRTNRGPYAREPIEASVRARLQAARSLFGDDAGAPLARVHLIDEPATIRTIGTFVGKNAGADFTHQEAYRETYRYIHFTQEQIASAVDGFAISQLLGPIPSPVRQLLRAVLSPASMRVLRNLGIPGIFARQTGALVAAAPLLVCVCIPRATPWAELSAGGLAMDLWMRATAAGLALQPVSVILQHDDMRRRFEDIISGPASPKASLGLEGRAVFFARVGRPIAAFPPTPRRLAFGETQAAGWLRL